MVFSGGKVITVNAGSSSIKIEIFKVGAGVVSGEYRISIADIGQASSKLHIKNTAGSETQKEVRAMHHKAAATIIMQHIVEIMSDDMVVAVGHRVVHGAGLFTEPTPVGAITDANWDMMSALDPLHVPSARELVELFKDRFPNAQHIACFDTAFFHDLPEVATIVPIPRKYHQAGVRRYGFHGLSYESLLAAFRAQAGDVAVNGRVVMAHLGSGASVTALKGGKPVDTTMGFTPTSGIVMSTRSGNLDPTTFSFLRRHNDMTNDEFDHMVNFESGLLGVSGISGDMYTLLQMENDNPNAATAIKLFVYEVKKAIGMFGAVLGGVDSLIFSGGIGEQSAVLRARICDELGYMGIRIDESANEQNAFLISSEQSEAGVHVISADEASVIARQTMKIATGEEYGIN